MWEWKWTCAALCLVATSACADVTGTIRMIDGDTLDAGETRVRLFGIDAPEQGQTCRGPDGRGWRCGAWVTRIARDRYEGRIATCIPVDRDRYGRVVARCSVAGTDIGGSLVSDGLAFAYRRYSRDYVPQERQAARRGAGLHAHEVARPSDFRQAQRTPAAAAPGTGCAIKGNISRDGTRIFHSPGQRHYDETRINISKGERWFCTAAAALAAGWRAARR